MTHLNTIYFNCQYLIPPIKKQMTFHNKYLEYLYNHASADVKTIKLSIIISHHDSQLQKNHQALHFHISTALTRNVTTTERGGLCGLTAVCSSSISLASQEIPSAGCWSGYRRLQGFVFVCPVNYRPLHVCQVASLARSASSLTLFAIHFPGDSPPVLSHLKNSLMSQNQFKREQLFLHFENNKPRARGRLRDHDQLLSNSSRGRLF